MSYDTRVPVSTTRVGKCIVRVYDEGAYQTSITQYYPESESTPTPKSKSSRAHGNPVPFPKKKSRVKWVTPIKYHENRKGA